MLAVAVAVPGLAATAMGGSGGECFGRSPTIVADAYAVEGTPGDDVIVDRDGSGLIQSGGGDDRICIRANAFHEVYAGSGDDMVDGGDREDFVYPQAGGDLVRAGGGADLITDERGQVDDRYLAGGGSDDQLRLSLPYARNRSAGARVDLARGIARGHGLDRLAGFEHVEGTGRPDLLIGDAGDNDLDGIRGEDRIGGGPGDDLVLGTTVAIGEDGAGDDPAAGSDPWLHGGPGSDRVYGRHGSDNLFGGPGDDLLGGGVLDGAGGSNDDDFGDGGPGTDTCRGLERSAGCED